MRRKRAQSGGPPGVIRDAEIEQLMRDYAHPLLRAAGDGNLALMECFDAVTGSPRYPLTLPAVSPSTRNRCAIA